MLWKDGLKFMFKDRTPAPHYNSAGLAHFHSQLILRIHVCLAEMLLTV